MTQKRHQKQLKRRKNKQKDEQHYMMREYRRMSQYMFGQAIKKQEEAKSEQ
jgi:hypothetical protein